MGTRSRRGPPAQPVQLTPAESTHLRRLARSCSSSRIEKRVLAILALSRGEAVERVALLLECSKQSVINWRAAWLRSSRGVEVLEDRPHLGRPRGWDEDREEILGALLQRSPDQFGYRAHAWTSRLLSHELARLSGWRPSDRTVRRELKALGYVYKRPRYVLDPDPRLVKKSPGFADKFD